MAITRPAEPKLGALTDARLEMYMALPQFWSAGLGALLVSNVDPLMEHQKRATVVSFLDSPISDLKLLKLIHSKSAAAQYTLALWQETTQHALHLKVPAEEFLSWAKAHDVPGVEGFLRRAYPAAQKSAPVPEAARNRIMEYPFRGEMSSAIVIAISKAHDPQSYHSVWEELLKLAEQKVDPLLGVGGTGKIRFRNSKVAINAYEKSSLEKSLGRAVKAAKSPTRPHKTP